MAININECTSADSNSSVCKNVDGIPRNATSWIYVVWREGKHVRISNKSGSIGVHHWLTHFLVSHPSYRGSNEWYDWAMVQWHKDPQDDSNFTEKPHLWFGEYAHTVSSFNELNFITTRFFYNSYQFWRVCGSILPCPWRLIVSGGIWRLGTCRSNLHWWHKSNLVIPLIVSEQLSVWNQKSNHWQ